MAHYLETALRAAIKENNLDVIKTLIEHIQSSNKPSNPSKADMKALINGQSFLHYALECGNLDAYKMLFPYYQGDAFLLLRDESGESLFFLAIRLGYDDVARQLLGCYMQAGVSVRNTFLQADNLGITPLHWAAGSSNPLQLNWLLNHFDESDNIVDIVNLLDGNANTPLHYACYYERRSHVIALLKKGADPYLKNGKNESFFTYLENNPSFFDERDLSAELKYQILEAHRKLVRDNPKNQKLKKVHAQLALKVSLLEAVRSKIEFDYDISGPLDGPVRYVLYPGTQHIPDELYELIVADRKLLNSCAENLAKVASKLSDYNTDMQTERRKRSNNYRLIGMSIIPAACIGIMVAMVPPMLLMFVVACSMLLAVGFAMMIASSILYYLDRASHLSEVNASISEVEQISAKLAELERTNVDLLPVNIQIIRGLEARVKLLQQSSDSDKLSIGVMNALSEIKPIIAEITQATVSKNKPITCVVESKPPEAVLGDSAIRSSQAVSVRISSCRGALFNANTDNGEAINGFTVTNSEQLNHFRSR